MYNAQALKYAPWSFSKIGTLEKWDIGFEEVLVARLGRRHLARPVLPLEDGP